MALLVFVAARGLSVVVVSGGYSLGAVRRLLFEVASLVVEHWLSRPMACRIFSDQGLNLCPCVGRQILNHWATKEDLPNNF